MAGHSKWANIKHRKAGQDAKRGKIFTKMLREITVAVKTSGPDAASNPALRTAIDKALGANMRRDTIDNAIKKASGALEGVNYETIRYEGYGPGGTAVIVDCLTDNRNRTVADVRHAFSKAGGNLGTDGSVAYLFSKMGILSYAPSVDEDALIEAALEAGADAALLDNMDFETMRKSVDYTAGRIVLEASGNINESTVAQVAETGVDIISSGALTHSVIALDLSLKIIE